VITYATFHMTLGATVESEIRKRSPGTLPYDPEQVIPLMFASAERADPGCRKVVLTDRKTRFPAATRYEVIRFDADPERVELARAAAWAAYCDRANGHVAFVDSDLLVAQSLESVFRSRFDVALTYRNREEMPINIGVHFAHGDHLENAARFHRRTVELMLERHADRQMWLGGQYAASELVDAADFSRQRPHPHRQNGFSIRLLPSDVYNFSAPMPMDGFYPGKAILHFKGRRKASMAAYWERHLAETAPPRCRGWSRWLGLAG
jgi:hypothetical protein